MGRVGDIAKRTRIKIFWAFDFHIRLRIFSCIVGSSGLHLTPVSNRVLRGDVERPWGGACGANCVADFMSPHLSAQRLVEARRASRALDGFPGPMPQTLADSYQCQMHAIDLWGDALAGWKVGRVGVALEAALGAERLIGALFAGNIFLAEPGRAVEAPAIEGGFAAVEAEFVYRLAEDAPSTKLEWTNAEALALVAGMHIGIELAGSPLPTINDMGPTIVAADFGNNAGLILGPPIADWRARTDDQLACEMFVDGLPVGRGAADSLPGGPAAALAFTLALTARLGRPLRAGALISSGAVTGVHVVKPGAQARADFGALGAVECRIVPAELLGCRKTGAAR
jgi:2-keto-4-pentenoate hydratase